AAFGAGNAVEDTHDRLLVFELVESFASRGFAEDRDVFTAVVGAHEKESLPGRRASTPRALVERPLPRGEGSAVRCESATPAGARRRLASAAAAPDTGICCFAAVAATGCAFFRRGVLENATPPRM